jgi:hypothetical protein
MSHARLNRLLALAVFIATTAVYFMTLSPTVVFWDVGEFIAAAKLLQVPHPPGSPLFLLTAHLAMMLPLVQDQAVRAHAFSALLSSAAIAFTYLIFVRVIVDFRGVPEKTFDRITVYGAAIIGALSLAFGTTYWDNSIEAEVYGASMFFLTIVIWLAFRWLDEADRVGNEKYLLLVAYLIGLSLGVHLLALLAIFPVLMIVYIKRYEVTFKSFIWFGVVSVATFFVVYPGIVKILPGMMDGDWAGKKSDLIAVLPWAIMAVVLWGAYVSYRNHQKMLHIALMSVLLIFAGYTTYTSVLIRSKENPPMNENDPSNLARLTSYLGREQYGNAPLLMPRRWSQESHQQGIYTNYSSDMDYMVRYQLNHMFFRYVGWNFIGADGDTQDSGIGWKDTWGIPFFIGLIGIFFQAKKDWKMFMVFLTAFIILGPVLALYQNQQEPQPRERDYFYVGAYFVFSLWIAIGITGLIDLVRDLMKGEGKSLVAAGLVGVFFVGIPGTLVRMNYHEHDRSGNYVAWDYSYNMLQSCEKDAILFTNGDNDTFPLWYLQDVEGIRRDVRIVNLSLVNTPWYILQMKNKSYYPDALPVPISLSDQRIQNIQASLWEPRMMDVRVPHEAYERYGVTDTAQTNKGSISWLMRNTLQFGQTRAIRTQDIMILDIVRTNNWKRPIYFAVTCSPDSRIGLDDYLWFHGLAYRLEPRKVTREGLGMDPDIVAKNLYNEPEGFSKTPQYGYKWRRVNDPSVYFDENIMRMLVNLRRSFLMLAMYHAEVDSNQAEANRALDRMEQVMPRSKIPMGFDLESELVTFYHRIGNMQKFNEFADDVEKQAREAIASGEANIQSYNNPYRALIDLYHLKKDYAKEIELLEEVQKKLAPNDPGLKARIAATRAQMAAEGAGPK